MGGEGWPAWNAVFPFSLHIRHYVSGVQCDKNLEHNMVSGMNWRWMCVLFRVNISFDTTPFVLNVDRTWDCTSSWYKWHNMVKWCHNFGKWLAWSHYNIIQLSAVWKLYLFPYVIHDFLFIIYDVPPLYLPCLPFLSSSYINRFYTTSIYWGDIAVTYI